MEALLILTMVKNVERRGILILVGVSLTALVLGLAVAYPLIVSDFPSLSKVDIGVEVLYAYISTPISNPNIIGLWRNASIGREANNLVFSYLVVLNVTNYSNESARVSTFATVVGPEVSSQGSLSVHAVNSIIYDFREDSHYIGYNDVWNPHSSRLVGLTGLNGRPDTFYNALSSAVYLYGGVSGKVAYSNSQTTAASDLRQVQLQAVDGGYLYNVLVDDNHMLQLSNSGLEVDVVPRG
jgi:hypothetical protein